MADDDLERFAQGLSAAGSYQPTRPAVSVAAPSASPDPDMFARMIARGQAREAEIDQMSPLRRFFGGNLEKSEIMDRLPKLEAMRRGIVTEELKAKTEARQAETQRFQQESESRKFLLEKFDKLYGMSPEQRATAGPIYAEVIGDLLGRSNAKNAEVLKPLITKVFSNPDLGKQLRDIFDDPAFEPDLPGLTALFATQEVSKWPELREKAVEKAQKRWDALVASNLKTLVDETRQELGKTSVNAQDLIASAQRRFGAYAKSPIVQQAFIGRINSLTPEQQIELGMVPGKIQLGAQQKAADVLALAEPKVAAAAASTAGEIKRAEEAVTGPKISQRASEILAGKGLTPATASKEQIDSARTQARGESEAERIRVAKAQGENAAGIAQRVPEAHMKRIEDIHMAKFQVDEMSKLTKTVRLPKLVGGLSPWINEIVQTNRVGPIPLPDAVTAGFTPDEHRFLALIKDYADSVLRLRSGAQINEQEMKRMLAFLTDTSVKPEVFVARLKLQSDQLRAKIKIMQDTLKQSGYRVPSIDTEDTDDDSGALVLKGNARQAR